MPEQDDLLIATHALEEGLVTRERLLEALLAMASEWARDHRVRPLGTILVERKLMPEDDLRHIIASMAGSEPLPREATPSDSMRLGQLLVLSGVLTQAQLVEALKEQAEAHVRGGPRMRLGEFLVLHGFTTPQAIQRALSYQSKAVYSCEGCGTQFNLVNARRGVVYTCPQCRCKLVAQFDTIRVGGGTLIEPPAPQAAAEPPATSLLFEPGDLSIARVQTDRRLGRRLVERGFVSEETLRDAEFWQIEIAQFGSYVPLLEMFRRLGVLTDDRARQLSDVASPPLSRLNPSIPGYGITGWMASGSTSYVYSAQPQFAPGASGLLVLDLDRSGDPQQVEKFRHNALLLKRLDHPRLLKAYEYSRVALAGAEPLTLHYAVTEYLRGAALDQLVRIRGKLSPARALSIVADLASALTSLQRDGIIHGDLRPEHVFVDERYRARLLSVGQADPCEPLAKTDPRVTNDIPRLGILFYAMLAGHAQPPAQPPSPQELDAVKMPAEIGQVLRVMLGRDPQQRLRYFADLLALRGSFAE